MSRIIDLIYNFSDYIGSNGRDENEIVNAENNLELKFSDEYREYLKHIGLACFNGHELTGICNNARLNVVDVTKNEKKQNIGIPADWYVIEELNIDGIVIWQNKDGAIYETNLNGIQKKINDSLYEYIESCNE